MLRVVPHVLKSSGIRVYCQNNNGVTPTREGPVYSVRTVGRCAGSSMLRARRAYLALSVTLRLDIRCKAG